MGINREHYIKCRGTVIPRRDYSRNVVQCFVIQ